MLSRTEYGASAGAPTYVRITTPNNLELALEGLVRKVLQEQPKQEDIYAFAADYFETLLDIRDKAELPYQKAEDICPNRSEFEAQSLIKLATSFPKPAFLAAASSAIATEELCRVVDVDEIRAREENADIEATNVGIDEVKESEESTEVEANEVKEDNVEVKENEENPEGEKEEEAKETNVGENKEEEDKSEVLNGEKNIDELDNELELKDSNEDESKVGEEDVNNVSEEEKGSEIVNGEPLSENGDVFGEKISVNDAGNKTDGEEENPVEAEGTTENDEPEEGKTSDIPTENSVINENETDLSKEEQVLPTVEDVEPVGDEEKENLPKSNSVDKFEPMALETGTLEKEQSPSDMLIKSESTETTETIPAEDAERDIIKEFIDKEKDYCTMGNSTRSVEIAEIHEVDVEEGIPMKEDVIQEATAKELLVENSDLVGDVTSNGSKTVIGEGVAMVAAGGIIGGITYAAADNPEENVEMSDSDGQAVSLISVADLEESKTEIDKEAPMVAAGGIVGGITYAAPGNTEEQVEISQSEGQAESLISVEDFEESEKTESGENTRKKRDTDDQENKEAENGTDDSENIVAEIKNDDIDEGNKESNLESSSTTQEDETREITDPKTDHDEVKSTIEETSSEQEIKPELLKKSETESDLIPVADGSENTTISEADKEADNEGEIISKTDNDNDVEEKQDKDEENNTENKVGESDDNKDSEVESEEKLTETAKAEKLDVNSLMGEEVKDDNDSREPSLETIEEEKGDDKAANPESTPEPKESEETPIALADANEQSEDSEKNDKLIEDEQNDGSQDEVPNKSEVTTSPVIETAPSDEINPESFTVANENETEPNDDINKEAEAVVDDVIEKATENALKVESAASSTEEKNVAESLSSEPTIEVKEVMTEVESLPKQTEDTSNETLTRNDNESENGRSRSSKDSESLGDENPFISAEVKTLVEDEGSVEEPEGDEDEEDKIVPLNAEISPIEEKDEGQWAAQMGLVTAALTIQKTFRNYLQRKRNSSKTQDATDAVLEMESEVQEKTIESQSSALNESMSTDSSLSSSATKIQQSDHKSLKLTRRNTAVENATTNSFPEEDVKERTKSFSISHRVRDSEVWSTLEHELESAATTIQNSYKNYKNRQRLRREDAVQITTTGSEDSVGSPKREGLQGTGELHDVIVPEESEKDLY